MPCLRFICCGNMNGIDIVSTIIYALRKMASNQPRVMCASKWHKRITRMQIENGKQSISRNTYSAFKLRTTCRFYYYNSFNLQWLGASLTSPIRDLCVKTLEMLLTSMCTASQTHSRQKAIGTTAARSFFFCFLLGKWRIFAYSLF